MARPRIELHNKLKELLGSTNVYYQIPPSKSMEYPAIKYSKSDLTTTKANDSNYNTKTKYEIIVIDRRPDNQVIDKLLLLPYSSYDRHYVSDNLNHDVLTLYF